MKSLTLHEPLISTSPEISTDTVLKYKAIRDRINRMRKLAQNDIIFTEEIKMGSSPIINDEWTVLTSNLMEERID